MEKSEFNQLFGRYISDKRNALGLSQSQLAALLGNNAQNISRIERGLISPTLFWSEKLAKAFNLEIEELVSEFAEYRRKAQ